METEFRYGKKLREIRRERGLSQEEVALSANITTSYYGQLERGQANPSVALLEKICRVLSVPLSDIFSDGSANILEIDSYAMQILYQMSGCTEQEREIILANVKLMIKLKNLNK